jgi:hypothetical protein
VVQAFLNHSDPPLSQLDTISQQVVERKFAKVAKGKIEWGNTLKHVAREFDNKENWDQALEKLEELKSLLSELSEVNNFYFIFLWCVRSVLVKSVERKSSVNENWLEKVDEINSLLGELSDVSKKEKSAIYLFFDIFYVTYIFNIFVNTIINLHQQEPFNKLSVCTTFVETESPEISKIQKQIFEKKFSKEVQGKIEWVRTLLNVANQCHEKSEWDQALGKIEEGRDVLSYLKEVWEGNGKKNKVVRTLNTKNSSGSKPNEKFEAAMT